MHFRFASPISLAAAASNGAGSTYPGGNCCADRPTHAIAAMAKDDSRISALGRDSRDDRLDVADRVREPLHLVVVAAHVRYVIGHQHPVVTDFLIDACGLQHVDAAVVDERIAEVPTAALS